MAVKTIDLTTPQAQEAIRSAVENQVPKTLELSEATSNKSISNAASKLQALRAEAKKEENAAVGAALAAPVAEVEEADEFVETEAADDLGFDAPEEWTGFDDENTTTTTSHAHSATHSLKLALIGLVAFLGLDAVVPNFAFADDETGKGNGVALNENVNPLDRGAAAQDRIAEILKKSVEKSKADRKAREAKSEAERKDSEARLAELNKLYPNRIKQQRSFSKIVREVGKALTGKDAKAATGEQVKAWSEKLKAAFKGQSPNGAKRSRRQLVRLFSYKSVANRLPKGAKAEFFAIVGLKPDGKTELATTATPKVLTNKSAG